MQTISLHPRPCQFALPPTVHAGSHFLISYHHYALLILSFDLNCWSLMTKHSFMPITHLHFLSTVTCTSVLLVSLLDLESSSYTIGCRVLYNYGYHPFGCYFSQICSPRPGRRLTWLECCPCTPRSCGFDSQSGTHPGCRPDPQTVGVPMRSNRSMPLTLMSLSLSLPLSLSSSLAKIHKCTLRWGLKKSVLLVFHLHFNNVT